jgi:glucosamine--fructose-6-phosphate aminotransferase (isomerizing)
VRHRRRGFTRNIVPILVQGLQRLEYRGYDSCGVAVHAASLDLAGAGLRSARSTARVAELMAQVQADALQGGTGIAHTRWATHGAPAVHNAHPHFSHGPGADAQERPGRVALVHNGIIENHEELRAQLQAVATCLPARPTPRSSPTWWTACTTATCSTRSGGGQAAARRLRHCRVAQGRAAPRGGRARRLAADPGRGQGGHAGEHFLASDAMALAGVTDQIVYLEEGDVVDLQLGRYWIVGKADPQAGAAPGAHGAGPQRRGRAGPLPALHAEGNLRAAARHRRHARRRAGHRARAVRRRRVPRVFKAIDRC